MSAVAKYLRSVSSLLSPLSIISAFIRWRGQIARVRTLKHGRRKTLKKLVPKGSFCRPVCYRSGVATSGRRTAHCIPVRTQDSAFFAQCPFIEYSLNSRNSGMATHRSRNRGDNNRHHVETLENREYLAADVIQQNTDGIFRLTDELPLLGEIVTADTLQTAPLSVALPQNLTPDARQPDQGNLPPAECSTCTERGSRRVRIHRRNWKQPGIQQMGERGPRTRTLDSH